MGRIGHETAYSQRAQQNLQQAAHDYYGQGFTDRTRVLRYDDRHSHGHGSRGAGNLGSRTTEYSGEKTNANRAVQSSGRSHTRGDTEGERNRQPHYRGGDRAKQITAERNQTVVQARSSFSLA